MYHEINELMSANGANEKKRVLEKYAGSEAFRRFLYYALNPLLTYNVTEERLRTPSESQISNACLDLKDIFGWCDYLSGIRGVSDLVLASLRRFLASVENDDLRELYISLLAKTIRLGVTAKTVNKVIPGLLPDWEVQQAYPIDKYPLAPGTEFWLTEKLNGVRATFYRGKLVARSGQVYKGLGHITDAISYAFGLFYVLDGELTLKDKSGLSDNEAFRTAAGIINSDHDQKTQICFTVFDCIPVEEFESGSQTSLYADRRNLLDQLAQRDFGGAVRILPALYHGTDQSKIVELLDRMVREDKEGLMVNLNTYYKRTRHRGILKVKRFYTMDLRITDTEEGSGRLKGSLGALVVDFHGNPVRVGTGFTDEERTRFWSGRASLIGSLCEVKYKEISYDKSTGEESLQFPVFVRIRNDKSEVSYG